MTKCPYCAEEIQDAAKKCKHCGEWIDVDSGDGFDLTSDDFSEIPKTVMCAWEK
jgi:uncharacterized membrane protein YvbJ